MKRYVVQVEFEILAENHVDMAAIRRDAISVINDVAGVDGAIATTTWETNL